MSVDELRTLAREEAATTPPGRSEALADDWKPRKPEYLVMISLSIISLIVALDSTILVPVLPTISSALKGSANDAFWTGTSYLLASAVCQPFIGAVSDIFGRRELLLLSLFFFTSGTLVCSLSQNFTHLLAGRSIKGVGGGGILVMVQVVFSDIVPLRFRPKWFACVQFAWAFGTVTGPVIGGLIAQHTTWRWVFYINFPFCGIALAVVPLVVRIRNKRQLRFRENILRVDWIGGVLFIGSTTSFLMALTWGGVEYPWSSWRTLIPLVVGFVGIFVTLAWEKWGAKRPLIRLWLINSLSAVGAYVSAMIQGLLLFGYLYYVSFWLETVKELSPTMSGVGIISCTGGLTPASIVVGILITRTGRFRWAIWSGWAVSLLAAGLLILWGTGTPTVGWVMVLLVLGIGHGLLLNAINFTVQATARPEDAAYAGALYAFLRSFGMCLGVGIGGVVFQNMMASALAARDLPRWIAKDATRYLVVLKGMEHGQERTEILEAYAEAFRGVFIVLCGVTAVGFGAGWLVGKHTMDREQATEHVLSRGEETKRNSLNG